MVNEWAMGVPTVLIDRYRYLASTVPEDFYGSEANRWKAVGIVKEMNDIAVTIRDTKPEDPEGFVTLLNDPVAAPWAAKHLLEIFDVSDELEQRAIAAVEKCSGESYWPRRLRDRIRALERKCGGAI